MRIRPSRSARAAFTLIELLAVLLIIAILVGVLLANLRDSERAVRMQNTAPGGCCTSRVVRWSKSFIR